VPCLSVRIPTNPLDYAISHNLTPFISMQNHLNVLYREVCFFRFDREGRVLIFIRKVCFARHVIRVVTHEPKNGR
jgi:hypothetical protein